MLIEFCAFGGAYLLYAIAVLLAGIGLWKRSQRLPSRRWLFSAAACLVLAAAAHWFTLVELPHIFAGAITG